MRRLVSNRFGGVVLFYLIFLVIALVIRLVLLVHAWRSVDLNPLKLVGMMGCGFLFDLGAASGFAIPMILYLTLLPQRWFESRLHRLLSAFFYFAILYLLIFVAIAEWFFWEEFSSRFNFIAVDYLVYTTEVIGNIRESYPLPAILGGLFVVASLVFFGFWKTGWLQLWQQSYSSWRSRFGLGAAWLVPPILLTLVLNNRQVPEFGNAFNQELAKDGIYSFFAAYRENELSFDRFYSTLDDQDAFKRVRKLLRSDNARFLSDEPTDLTRLIKNAGDEKRYNVIQITVESLSARFLGVLGNRKHITPNLDALSEQSLFFTNFYATGNRTVRGMEALTLSIPPTPGQSIVRRPNNEQMFTLGSVFRSRGYETVFLYGGFGYFDNMNYFFEHNGYKVIDRASVSKDEITFGNVWGACDEDLFNWTLKEADASFARGKPFHHFVMTTSNHRPYTYPDGKIDIPSHSGRFGAIKYTDYAIGELLRKAREKPWFTNTLFVIVADHCASSAGKTALPVNGYAIPLFIYNPGLIQPRKVGALCSQIDLAPTLLGMLNWTYQSRFYGKDVFKLPPAEERAFIANYQKLGYLQGNQLGILQPVRQKNLYQYDRAQETLTPLKPGDDDFLNDTIAYYQTASYLFTHQLHREIESK